MQGFFKTYYRFVFLFFVICFFWLTMELQHKEYHLFLCQVSKIYFTYLITPIDFTLQSKYYAQSYLRLHLNINQNTHRFIFTVILETFAKFGGCILGFISKSIYSLLSVENYQNMKYTENINAYSLKVLHQILLKRDFM